MTNPKIVVDGKPAREWWINSYREHSVFVAHKTLERAVSDKSNPCDEQIHVIEYSAYEGLKNKHEELLSYLPKVPSSTYEKDLAIQVQSLRKKNETLLSEANKLAEALEFECGGRCAEGINPCNAREALASWTAFREGKEK